MILLFFKYLVNLFKKRENIPLRELLKLINISFSNNY